MAVIFAMGGAGSGAVLPVIGLNACLPRCSVRGPGGGGGGGGSSHVLLQAS